MELAVNEQGSIQACSDVRNTKGPLNWQNRIAIMGAQENPTVDIGGEWNIKDRTKLRKLKMKIHNHQMAPLRQAL